MESAKEEKFSESWIDFLTENRYSIIKVYHLRQNRGEIMTETISRQKLQLVANTFLFRNVDEFTVERMLADERCEKRKYEKGSVIFDEGNFIRSLGIILSGEVRVEKNTADGKRLKMSTMGPGGCFGAAAMFHDRGKYLNVITAEKSAEVIFLSEGLITWAMQRDPVITENYISYLSDRIWFLNAKIAALTAGTAEQRLAVYLLEHGGAATSMTDLSSILNIGRASLYRALDDMEAQGLISRGNKSIEIKNEDGLRFITLSK